MLNGGHKSKDQKQVQGSDVVHQPYRRAASWLKRMLRFRSAADLACKVPLILVAMAVLLLVNTSLQYAVAPALQRAFPLHDGSSRSQTHASTASGLARHIPQGLVTEVIPGGADAELLCVDKQRGCDSSHCSRVSVKFQDCKASCDACEQLRASIQSDTGLQIRVVQQLSHCQDLHPNCAAWQHADRCSKDPKSMLELCQASCGFCLPQAASPLAGDPTGSSSSTEPVGLLDECQDDINVCPFLASSGLCSSGSLWVETQCPRSCGRCTTGAVPSSSMPGYMSHDPGSEASWLAERNRHHHSGSSTSSGSSSSSSTAAANAAGVLIREEVVGSPQPSRHRLYGRNKADAAFSWQALEEWTVVDCHDHADRCSAWVRDGECSKNIDYMMIACKASCGNCKTYQTRQPFEFVQLNSGWSIPAVGFGTAGLGVGTAAAVEYAAAVGYRMFDTAESKDWYDEQAVGLGLFASKVPRHELFLTSKIHPRDLGYNQTLAAFSRSLQHLRTDYLDLLLLHYPACFPGANCIPQPMQTWQDSWVALEDLVRQGKARSIGVSNFGLSEMQELLKLSKIKPAVLETRSDPFAVNRHLISMCIQHNITFIGYSTLGTQWINSPMSINPVFNSSLLQAVADRHPDKSLAQVVLRWALQKGQVVIPRSSSLEHIPENMQLFDLELSDAEMQAIDTLDGTWKTGGLPLPVA